MSNEFKELQRKAEDGDLLAQYELAMAYLRGDVTGKSEVSEGMKWINRFGESGNAEVKYICGKCFKELGMYTEAFNWYFKAAAAGSAEAEAEMAAFYLAGLVHDKNERLALVYAQRAFNAGEKNVSPMILASLYLQGGIYNSLESKNIEQDPVKAYKYLKISKENGNEEAVNMIKLLEKIFPQLSDL